jgi:hypothetical protein
MTIYTRRHQTNGFVKMDRPLKDLEQQLLTRVFRSASLPSFASIRISNQLGPTGRPFTIHSTSDDYYLHVGKALYDGDLSILDGATLVHETTHVWQYNVGTLSGTHALFAHLHYSVLGKDDDLYKYNVSHDTWNDMGFEGQAQLVEDWFRNDGMSETSERFVFVKKVLYTGDSRARDLTLTQLRG